MTKIRRVLTGLMVVAMAVAILPNALPFSLLASAATAALPKEGSVTRADFVTDAPKGYDSALDLFVSPTGNDSNDGKSIANARATIDSTAKMLQPGGTLYVLPGVYVGDINLRRTNNGTAEAWKRIKAYDANDRPIITKGTRMDIINIEGDTNATATDTALAGYWELDGLDVVGGNWDYTHADPWSVIKTKDEVAADVGGGSTGYDNAAFDAYGRYGTRCVNAEHIVIRNTRVRGVLVTGVFSAYARNYTVENCWSEANGEHGYYYNNSADNFRFANNVSIKNDGCGFHLNADAGNPPSQAQRDAELFNVVGVHEYGIYEYNYTSQNCSSWFNLHQRDSVLFGGTGAGLGAAFNLSSLRYGIVRGNISYNDYSGIALYCGTNMDCPRDLEFYNNTILTNGSTSTRYCINFDATAAADRVSGGITFPNDRFETPLNLKFYNNIIGRIGGSESLLITCNTTAGRLLENHGVEFVGNVFLGVNQARLYTGGSQNASINAQLDAEAGLNVCEPDWSKVFKTPPTLTDGGDFTLVDSIDNPAVAMGIAISDSFLPYNNIVTGAGFDRANRVNTGTGTARTSMKFDAGAIQSNVAYALPGTESSAEPTPGATTDATAVPTATIKPAPKTGDASVLTISLVMAAAVVMAGGVVYMRRRLQ